MAYLILSMDGQEWDRRELLGSTVVGRSPDCDVSVHDILLSRRHCQITPTRDGWLLIDLASRNGTVVRDKAIDQVKLKHGDVIRVGKTKVTFRADAFMPSPQRPNRPEIPPLIARDETIAGMVVAMDFEPSMPTRFRRTMNRPTPKPRPKDPASFEDDNLYAMLEQIASNSWDSIYATNSRPIHRDRLFPEPIVGGKRYGMTGFVQRQNSPAVNATMTIPTAPVLERPVPPAPVPKVPPRHTTLGLVTWTRQRVSRLMMRIRPAMESPLRRAA